MAATPSSTTGIGAQTNDLDVWIAVDPDNADRVARVLRDFAGFSAGQVRPSMFLEKGKVFIIGREPVRIDILTAPSGVEFGDCYKRRNQVVWDGIKVPLISLEDLRANKLASGRTKDLADLEYLPAKAVGHQASRAWRRKPHRRKNGS